RQLNRRLGEVDPGLIERVRELSADQLEVLAEALLDFSEVSDLVAWLEMQRRREREVTLVTRQLNQKLGEVERSLIDIIRELPIEQLDSLAQALIDFSQETDLVAWLRQQRLLEGFW
ncbi:MAG TPA: hypothetical protein DCE56_24005, partial [Cyanobacteria bacterium UBA8553]|nr:hypothetical protein [Cyanobacteria bacterium UBA8553]